MSADQYFSVVLTVDLSCNRCHDKIKKILSKHKEKWCIQSTIWDEKNNKITLTGPFCPRKLSKRLRRKACKIIKDIDIPDACDCDQEKKKPADPKPEPPKKEEPKAAPPPPASKPEKAPAVPVPDPPKEKPKPVEPKAPKPAESKPKTAEPKPADQKPKPAEPKAPPPAEPETAAVPYPYPYPPVFPMPICWGGPWCECQAVGGCTPCGYGGACGGGCGGDRRRGQPCPEGSRVEFFCEEDSTCRQM